MHKVILEEFEASDTLKVTTATIKNKYSSTFDKTDSTLPPSCPTNGLGEEGTCPFLGIKIIYLSLYYPTH